MPTLSNPTKSPSVTIAIPAYNEAEYIESIISVFLDQNFPGLVEILIADGGSNDGTQNIVEQISKENPTVKLLHNPGKIQSCALNIMVKEAKGDIFLRADAHSKYANDYIKQCVAALIDSGAVNVGGSQRYIASTPFQAGVALASRSPLTGSAKYLNTNFSGYADTVYLGCFWREKLCRLINEYGYREIFDSSQVTNQDAELNLKINQAFENGIYVSSAIKVWYFARKSWNKLLKQYFKFGRGRYLTFTKHPDASPLRSRIPIYFFAVLAITTFLALGIFQFYRLTALAYALILIVPIAETGRLTKNYRQDLKTEIWHDKSAPYPNTLRVAFYCFLAMMTIPSAFSAGYFYQVFRRTLLRTTGW